MNRHQAKELAQTATPQQLKQMFINAQNNIKDWTKPSRVNKGLTKGTAFNILSACIKDTSRDKLAITNMIHEFGEYLPDYEEKILPAREKPKPHHQEPKSVEGADWFNEF